MSERIAAPHVGAPDPDSRNSTIVEETDEAYELAGQEAVDSPVCWFNGQAWPDRAYVCSGDELLRCMRGMWLRMGSCDPVNP